MPICNHCMLEFPEREAVYDHINGTKLIFCCHGCNGIYRLIHNEGLDQFYERRRDWSPGPPETKAIDVASFVDNVRPVGDEVETNIVIDGIRCASCVWLNEKILLRTRGVTAASVNYATHRAKIRWNPREIDTAAVLSRIKSIGYTPKPFLHAAWEEEQKRQSRDLLIRFGTASFFSMQLMLFSIALYAGYFQGIDEKTKFIFHVLSLVLTTPVLFYSGWPIIKSSIQGIRNLNFSMDVLIAAGSLSAYIYSIYETLVGGEVYFDTSAMIVTLILLGRFIEAGAKGRASATIGKLMQLSPKEARKLAIERGGKDARLAATAQRFMVPVSELRPGDIVEVIPGEKIAVDGIVFSGSSEADESMLTGESKPAAKSTGSLVYGGTINLYGSFVFEVTKTGRDTVLSQIIQAVEDAQSRRAPIQSLADRVVTWFVPAVLLISSITFFGWLYYGSSAAHALMNAVSVMVIACPCALGLATPLAILIGTTRAATLGILIKGGDVIEKTAAVDTAVLDKTGTITRGTPALIDYFSIDAVPEEGLRLAVSLEKCSEHSVGRAILEAGRNLLPYEVSEFHVLPGKGISGMIQGAKTLIGSKAFLEADGLSSGIDTLLSGQQRERIRSLKQSGATVVYLSRAGALRAVFAVSDQPRKEAPEAVSLLKLSGLGIAMVTGDNATTATAIAKMTGIEEVHAQMSPLEKAATVQSRQAAGLHVLMAGDGINDAPALVQASVGVAMGRGATDIALESADMVILRNDLRLIPVAVGLSRKTFSIIKQNIFWAFFYNIVAIPLAIAGVLHPIMAAAAMTFSSLSVIGNSLRARTPI